MRGCFIIIASLGLVGIAFSQIAGEGDAKIPSQQFWPEEVTLAKEQIFRGKAGKAEVQSKVSAGTKVHIFDLEDQTIISKRGEMTARIPVADTDFLVIANANASAAVAQREKDLAAAEIARVAREKQSAATAAADLAAYGKPPLFGPQLLGDGIVIPSALARTIKQNLKDPGSFQARKAISIAKAERNGVKCYQLIFEYGAKNSFGGYVTGIAEGYVRESTVVDLVIRQD